MRNSWDTWFLDCRYEKNATSLVSSLAKRFPNHTVLTDMGPYVRLVYDSAISDEFGSHHAPVLVHAYSGFDTVAPEAVGQITQDDAHAFRKTIVGARFTSATREAAAKATVRCVPLEEIYFVNDPYAKLCREFLRQWDSDRSTRHLSFVVDLDFRPSGLGISTELRKSVLTFLEEQLNASGRFAVLVHGDFGCGKTTTAKQLVADLSNEYLRGDSNVPKVMYVDVNNIDIRSRRDECIENQLSRFRLPRECIDGLVAQVRDDVIHLVFDGVDEMARPYTGAGRHGGIELLRDVANRRAAVYFVRSSYYPQLGEMIAEFDLLSDHDFSKKQKGTVVAEILGLRQEQVTSYLESRLGSEEARLLRSGLHKMGLQSFLGDPLIASLVANLVEEQGMESIESFPTKGRKAHFLSYLVEQLLKREQSKRSRHGALAENFELFQRVLRGVAFNMVCRGSAAISPSQLEAFVYRGLESASRSGEAVDAFRTMSWIHRSDEGALSFRHEALTLVCAAEHVCTAFERRDSLTLAEWQPGAPLAAVVCDYAGETINSIALLGAAAMLGGELQFNVRQLAVAVLEAARGREDLDQVPENKLDEKTIAAVCRGIITEPMLAQLPIRVLFKSLSDKRKMQVMIPLMWLFARKDLPESVAVAVFLLEPKIKPKWNFYDELEQAKKDPSSSVDAMLLKDLHISAADLLDAVNYEGLFKRIYADDTLERHTTQYADRTLKAIEGERHRRQSQFGKEAQGR
jgi:predicted transcriptional regulator